MAIEIVAARAEQIPAVTQLLRDYAAWLEVDLCFQNFDKELATLPGEYAAPRGRLLVACDGDQVVGCVALRPLGGNDCEMKRLFVVPAFRGQGIARRLAERLIAAAASMGYHRMLLDTLQQMDAARGMYASLGFSEIPAYYHNPIPGAIYMALTLVS